MNRSQLSGDSVNSLGNCVFASKPGHIFWVHVIDSLLKSPLQIDSYQDVLLATGPLFLTRIYYTNQLMYKDITVPDRRCFHHVPPRRYAEYQKLIRDKEVYGIHHGWGSWKERMTSTYLHTKMKIIINPIT